MIREQIERTARTTAGIYKINQTDLSRFVLPLAPLAEQDRILIAVEDVMSIADATIASTDGSARRCHRLRQAVLKWAFEGKLVDQDPTDESASVLLERIKAEREQAMDTNSRPPRRGRKKATA